MANVELTLISNIIRDGDISTLRRSGFNAAFLQTEEGREMYRWISDAFTNVHTGGVVPSLDRVRRHFPEFDYCPSRDPIDALAKEVVDNNVKAGIRASVEEIDGLLDEGEDPQVILGAYLPQLRELSLQGSESKHLLMSSAALGMREDYDRMQEAGGITGLPFPWAPLNKATAGMQPEDFIVIYARPKQMKCLEENQRVMLADGTMMPIGQSLGQVEVPSYTAATGHFRFASADKVYSGKKNCVRVVMESGEEVLVGDEHYFMVPPKEGLFQGTYERARNLRTGDLVAMASELPEWQPLHSGEEEGAWLLGVLLGDGCTVQASPTLTNADTDLVSAVRTVVEKFGCLVVPRKGSTIEYGIPSKEDHQNNLVAWLKEVGAYGVKAREKHTPQYIFQSTPGMISAYLAGLLDTDGTVHTHTGQCVVSWYTSSIQMAADIQHLLLRLGVRGRRYYVKSRDAWAVSVANGDDFRNLVLGKSTIGHHVRVEYKKKGLYELLHVEARGRYKDGLPLTSELLAKLNAVRGARPWPPGGRVRRGWVSRGVLQALYAAWGSQEIYAMLDDSRRWERIKEVREEGEHECYDYCVTDGGDPNYVAQDFVVHNTWVAISIACHAYLCGYRVLVYSKEMSDRILARRAASIIAEIDYEELKSGQLSAKDENKFFNTLEGLSDWEKATSGGGRKAAMTFLSDRKLSSGSKGATVDILSAEAERFGADLIIVDGFYLMRDGRTNQRSREWKQVSNISSDLKNMAQTLAVPVIGTTQANRGASKTSGDDTDEVGYADAIGQDTDLLMRVFKARNLATGKPKLMFTFPGTRDAVLNPFVINAHPGKDFSLLQATVDVNAFLKDKKDHDEDEARAEGGGSAPTPAAAAFGTPGKSGPRKKVGRPRIR